MYPTPRTSPLLSILWEVWGGWWHCYQETADVEGNHHSVHNMQCPSNISPHKPHTALPAPTHITFFVVNSTLALVTPSSGMHFPSSSSLFKFLPLITSWLFRRCDRVEDRSQALTPAFMQHLAHSRCTINVQCVDETTVLPKFAARFLCVFKITSGRQSHPRVQRGGNGQLFVGFRSRNVDEQDFVQPSPAGALSGWPRCLSTLG